MPYVFVSHAIQADGIFASRLAGDLRARSVQIWKAPESIKPGERWPEAIEKAVEACDTMLTVLTPEAAASRWVATEMNMAIEREHEGKMTVVPLDLKPCKIPRLWSQYQRVSFGDYEKGLKELLQKLGISTSASAATIGPLSSLLKSKAFDWSSPLPGKQTASDSEAAETPLFDWQSSALPLKKENPWDKYVSSLGQDDLKSKPLPRAKMPELSNYDLVPDATAQSLGEEAQKQFQYRKAIEHYTRAIESYEKGLISFLFLSEQRKRALGAIYYKRGQCWMSLDLWSALGKVEKAPLSAFSKPKVGKLDSAISRALAPKTSQKFGLMFPSLLHIGEEFSKAQADFAKAKELGYESNDVEKT